MKIRELPCLALLLLAGVPSVALQAAAPTPLAAQWVQANPLKSATAEAGPTALETLFNPTPPATHLIERDLSEVSRLDSLRDDSLKRRLRRYAVVGAIAGGVATFVVMPKSCDVSENMTCQYLLASYPLIGAGVGAWIGIGIGYFRERERVPR